MYKGYWTKYPISEDESLYSVKGLTFSRKKEKAFSDQFFAATAPCKCHRLDFI